jgi:putative membrane protein
MKKYIILLILLIGVIIWSAYEPKDYLTWLLETIPVYIGLLFIFYYWKSYTFSFTLLIILFIHSIILLIGGHYTYAEVPFFESLSYLFNWKRNNYDKLGHFMQGVTPAYLIQDIFKQKKILSNQEWILFLSISVSLSFSAFYELIEYWVALLIGQNADEFLGTQGYVWDTQSDMMFALIGAVVTILATKIKAFN